MEQSDGSEKFLGYGTLHIHCPYCHGQARLVGGDTIYPHRQDLADNRFWFCQACESYVGCHAGTTFPMGRIANASLRALKMKAHAAFDPLWKGGLMKRKEAYKQLAAALNIPLDLCHMGMFDEKECEEVIRVCEDLRTQSNA